MRIDVFSGDAASRLLADPEFGEEWNSLAASCPWATPYQGRLFSQIWYETYSQHHIPLVVAGRDDALVGLLLLCVNSETGAVAHVGTHQAEYQGWLALPDRSDAFISSALRELKRHHRARSVCFLFLSPGAPTAWAGETRNRDLGITLRWSSRGLMRVDESSSIDLSLGKSGNKNKLTKLKRLGPVEAVQLQNSGELRLAFDAISLQCDVRQGGVHGGRPFSDDPLKRSFYLRMADAPGLLHACVLRAGDRIAASHMGLIIGDSVSLGVITHDPLLSSASPGKLMILMLARMLSTQGFRWFDLTPIGSYKERFTTDYDQVAVLKVSFSRLEAIKQRIRGRIIRQIGSRTTFIRRLGEKVLGKALSAVVQLRTKGAGEVARETAKRGRFWIGGLSEFRTYRFSLEGGSFKTRDSRFRVNHLEDLLLYEPVDDTNVTVQEFLSRAVSRLEGGALLFSCVSNGRLVNYSWLTPSATHMGSDFGHEVSMDGNACVLWDDYTRPDSRGQGLQKESIEQRLRYAAEHGLGAWAVCGVRADNTPSRKNYESRGFEYCGSMWLEVRLGKERRWTDLRSAPFLNDGSR